MSDKSYLSVYAKSFSWAGFFLPKKTFKKSERKVSKENPFGILKNLNFN